MKINLKVFILSIIILSCNDRTKSKTILMKDDLLKFAKETGSSSFMPLETGNYWKHNDENYTEVKNIIKIGTYDYHEVYSLVGGDASFTEYLRIDKNNNLISASPRDPKHKYIKAKFDLKLNETFYTVGDQSVNDFLVTVIAKTESEMTFKMSINSQSAKYSYIKGIGFYDSDNPYKEIKINGKILK